MRRSTRFALIAAASGAVALPLAVVKDVRADTAPQLTCGGPGTSPCTQTAHFSDVNVLVPPLPPGAGCPAALTVDFATIVGSGNGVEHVTINKAEDFWFTLTFTGLVTITSYAPDQVDPNSDPQHPVLIPGATPDSHAPVYSGTMTQWFGASGNRQNAVFHDTLTIHATGTDGSTVALHDVSHTSYTPGTSLSGPPHLSFDHLSC